MLVLTVKPNQVIKIGEIELFIRKDLRGSNKFRVYLKGDKEIRIKRTDKFYGNRENKNE